MSSESTLVATKEDPEMVIGGPSPSDKTSPRSEALTKPLNTGCFVGTWDQADPYLRDNEYIRKGYRINFNSTKRILRSLFMCHNESTNIWSHLCGSIMFITLMIYIIVWVSPDDTLEPYKLGVVPENSTSPTTYGFSPLITKQR